MLTEEFQHALDELLELARVDSGPVTYPAEETGQR